MKYLHSMLASAISTLRCGFLRRARPEGNVAQGKPGRRFTLVFLSATETPEAEIELTCNWPAEDGSTEDYGQRATSAICVPCRKHLRDCAHLQAMGVTMTGPARRTMPSCVRLICFRSNCCRTVIAAAGAVGVDAEYRNLVNQLSACSRSATRSSACSSPTERRSRFCGETGVRLRPRRDVRPAIRSRRATSHW